LNFFRRFVKRPAFLYRVRGLVVQFLKFRPLLSNNLLGVFFRRLGFPLACCIETISLPLSLSISHPPKLTSTVKALTVTGRGYSCLTWITPPSCHDGAIIIPISSVFRTGNDSVRLPTEDAANFNNIAFAEVSAQGRRICFAVP